MEKILFFLILKILFPKGGLQERMVMDQRVAEVGCGHDFSVSL